MSTRHPEKRSTIIITTNTAFSDWGNILYNTTIATAIADRLVENSGRLVVRRLPVMVVPPPEERGARDVRLGFFPGLQCVGAPARRDHPHVHCVVPAGGLSHDQRNLHR